MLLLGDSIIKGVNTKGLANEVHKHSISGGNIHQLIDEINLYDLKVFSTIIIYIGGNNVARGDNPSITEEKYDKLISLIKCSNRSCKIILCSIAPRTDADVSNFNQAVAKLAMHWRCQNVDYVSSTHDMFFKDGKLSTIYFHHDGIHLTASGTKRLLDALNRGFQIVKDFDNCVFTGKRNMNKANIGSGFHVPQRSNQGQFQAGRRPASGRFPLICFGCHRKGHKIADCWFNKKGLGITANNSTSAQKDENLVFNRFQSLSCLCIDCNVLSCACTNKSETIDEYDDQDCIDATTSTSEISKDESISVNHRTVLYSNRSYTEEQLQHSGHSKSTLDTSVNLNLKKKV